jgi:prepilin signal peptidase PulO-like enzyme (type II secretory pathway)
MTLLCALVGLLMGSLLDWAGDHLPRFTSSSVDISGEPSPHLRVALGHLLASSMSRRGQFQRSAWLGVAVELVCAILFAYLWTRFGLSWKLVWLVLTCSFFVLIAVIDLKYRLVLNVMIFPAAAIAVLVRILLPGRDILDALLGGVVGLSPFLLMALLRPGDMGGGDVKLAALIGLVTGFPQVLWAVSLSILVGGVTAIVLFLTHRRESKSHIPYAPFLCLGAICSLVHDPLSAVFSP